MSSRVVTFVDLDLNGLPEDVVAPEGYPVFVGWQATTYPIWNDDSEKAQYVQYPCVVAMWERAK